VDGEEVAGVRRVGFDFLPEFDDHLIERARGSVVFDPPDFVEDAVA